ncbi:hypothetical protein QYF36_007594 [Acer negundo]|nr:hypothetical protein QYF36_007594 [Acer negundo]
MMFSNRKDRSNAFPSLRSISYRHCRGNSLFPLLTAKALEGLGALALKKQQRDWNKFELHFTSRDENLPSHGAVPASLCPTRYAIDVVDPSHDCFNDVFNQDKKDTS